MTAVGRIERGLLIDGTEVPAVGAATTDVINPSTGEVIGMAANAAVEDVDRAVAAAMAAFEAGGWRDRPTGERARILHRLADLIGLVGKSL